MKQFPEDTIEAEIVVDVLDDDEEEAFSGCAHECVSWFQCVGQLGAKEIKMVKDSNQLLILITVNVEISFYESVILQGVLRRGQMTWK